MWLRAGAAPVRTEAGDSRAMGWSPGKELCASAGGGCADGGPELKTHLSQAKKISKIKEREEIEAQAYLPKKSDKKSWS